MDESEEILKLCSELSLKDEDDHEAAVNGKTLTSVRYVEPSTKLLQQPEHQRKR